MGFFFELNVSYIFSKSTPHSTDMFKMHSHCIIFCPFSPSLSSSCLLSQTSMPCNLKADLHSLTCNMSDFSESQSTTQRVCLCGVGWGEIWVKLWLTHKLSCSDQSPMVTVTWSMKLTQTKCGMFLKGYGLSPAQAKIYRTEWIFSKWIFNHNSDMNIRNKDWSLQSIGIRMETYLVSQLSVF